MNMKITSIIDELATIAPNIAVTVNWCRDHDIAWGDPMDGDWQEGEDPSDWVCWQSAVTATIIRDGKKMHGTAYLGGTWEKYGDDPRVSNPDISGYKLQMMEEAVGGLPADTPNRQAALDCLKQKMLEKYEQQRKEICGTKKDN